MTTITTECSRCHGTGRVNFQYANGICFGCQGRGRFVTTTEAIARREAREHKAEAKAAVTRAASQVVYERLLAAWGEEFAHIDPEYRHMHVWQKAQRIMWQDHRVNVKCVADLAEHYGTLGI